MEVKMNELGHIEIPQELCDKLRLKEGSAVEVSNDYKNILIKAHSPTCPQCGNTLGDAALKLCKNCERNLMDTYYKENK